MNDHRPNMDRQKEYGIAFGEAVLMSSPPSRSQMHGRAKCQGSTESGFGGWVDEKIQTAREVSPLLGRKKSYPQHLTIARSLDARLKLVHTMSRSVNTAILDRSSFSRFEIIVTYTVFGKKSQNNIFCVLVSITIAPLQVITGPSIPICSHSVRILLNLLPVERTTDMSDFTHFFRLSTISSGTSWPGILKVPSISIARSLYAVIQRSFLNIINNNDDLKKVF